MAKIQLKDFGRFLEKLSKKIQRQVFDASAQTLNAGITDSISKISVTGKTLEGWSKTVLTKPTVSTTRMIVGRFSKGNAELIQKGLTVFPKYKLPRFVTYDESPHLLEWAKKTLQNVPERGLFVGGINTQLGSKKNRWFDQGMDYLKRNVRQKGIEELQKIKI